MLTVLRRSIAALTTTAVACLIFAATTGTAHAEDDTPLSAVITINEDTRMHYYEGQWGLPSDLTIDPAAETITFKLPRDFTESSDVTGFCAAFSVLDRMDAGAQQQGNFAPLTIKPHQRSVTIAVPEELHAALETYPYLSINFWPYCQPEESTPEALDQYYGQVFFTVNGTDDRIDPVYELSTESVSDLPADYIMDSRQPPLSEFFVYPAEENYEGQAFFGHLVSLKAKPGFWTNGPTRKWSNLDLNGIVTAVGTENGEESTTDINLTELNPRVSSDGSTLTLTMPSSPDDFGLKNLEWLAVTIFADHDSGPVAPDGPHGQQSIAVNTSIQLNPMIDTGVADTTFIEHYFAPTPPGETKPSASGQAGLAFALVGFGTLLLVAVFSVNELTRATQARKDRTKTARGDEGPPADALSSV